MSPYGMSKEKFLEKLQGQTNMVEYMASHPDEFSPASEEHYPFMNYLFPSGTEVKQANLQADDPPRPWCRKRLVKFPEEWVPDGVDVVRAPVFKILVPPCTEITEPTAGRPNLELQEYESRVCICRQRKLLVGRTVDFARPMREDDPYFEKLVREALEDARQNARGAKLFLFHLTEMRFEVYGYLPNKVTMSAHIAMYSVLGDGEARLDEG